MSRSLLARLGVFALIGLLGLYYIIFDVIAVRVFNQPYQIKVVLPQGGNIYSQAYVTYRGVEVGKVASLALHPNDVVATLNIHKGVKIPADVTAHVKELTAAAEQYMDLVPTKADPPYLAPGAVIPENRTTVPVSIGQLLSTLNQLVSSVHASNLNTIATALGTGLQGEGDNLRTIIQDSYQLTEALRQAEPATISLLYSGNTVLRTALATSGDFAQWSRDLNLVSQQLARSNRDTQLLFTNGAAATAALSQLLNATTGSTVGVIDGLAAGTNVAYQRQPAVRALFQVLPVFANDIAATSSGGNIRFQLLFNDKNTVCPYTSQMAEPTSLVATASLTNNCSAEAPDLLQRGADKAPPPPGG
jgi:phospholipid/cholesterol/gamma-HCH transport system substrate-binding protein